MDGMGTRIRELEGQIWGELMGIIRDNIESRKRQTATLSRLTDAVLRAPCGEGKQEELNRDITPL